MGSLRSLAITGSPYDIRKPIAEVEDEITLMDSVRAKLIRVARA